MDRQGPVHGFFTSFPSDGTDISFPNGGKLIFIPLYISEISFPIGGGDEGTPFGGEDINSLAFFFFSPDVGSLFTRPLKADDFLPWKG